MIEDKLIYNTFNTGNSATKHDINKINDKISSLIEMNNNIFVNQ